MGTLACDLNGLKYVFPTMDVKVEEKVLCIFLLICKRIGIEHICKHHI